MFNVWLLSRRAGCAVGGMHLNKVAARRMQANMQGQLASNLSMPNACAMPVLVLYFHGVIVLASLLPTASLSDVAASQAEFTVTDVTYRAILVCTSPNNACSSVE